MTVFLFVLLAHLLYDFHWQGDFIAQNKSKYPFILAVHALTWTLCIAAVLWYFHALQSWHIPFLAITHYNTDWWKSRLPRTPEWFWAIYVDQGIHLLTLIIVCIGGPD
jgi:hypothetical protein